MYLRFSKRILIGILILLGLGLAGLEIMSRVYQKEAGAYFREQFTKQSDLVLQPFQTSISVWRHFPRITFSFQNISLLDTSNTAPVQVFWVKRAEVAVPLGQFRLDRVKINRVDLEEVLFYQRIDSSGQKTGLHFRRLENPDTTGGKLPFVIPKLNIRNARIISQNQYKNSSFVVNITTATLAAVLKDQRLNILGELNGKIGEIKNSKISFFRNQLFTGRLNYTYLLNQKKGVFEDTYALVNGNKISIKGSHAKSASGSGANLNLTVAGYQPLVYLFNQLLPPQAKPYLNRFKTNSRLHFVMRLSGESGPMQRPRNSIAFTLKNGEFYLPNSKKYIKAVQLAGEMNNGTGHSLQTSQFKISHVSATIGQGKIEAQLQVQDFTKPTFSLKGKGRLDLAELAGFIYLPLTRVTQGAITGDFGFSGNIPDTLQNTDSNFRGTGILQLQEAAFRPLGLRVDCRGVNSTLAFSGNLLQMQNLSGMLGGRPFRMQASIRNYFSYLFNEPGFIKASANIYAEHLDTEWLNDNLLAWQAPALPAEGLAPIPVNLTNSTPMVVNAAYQTRRPEFQEEEKGSATIRLVKKAPAKKRLKKYRQNAWDHTQTQLNLRVGNVNLPGGEKVKNLSVQVNQLNNRVKLTQMQFFTNGGGKATANGHFALIPAGISKPTLNVSLQYNNLNLQAFMQNIASMQEQSQPVNAAETAAKTERNMTTLKEKDYFLNLQVQAKNLEYLYLKGSNLFLQASLNKNRARVNKLQMQAFGGQLNARGEMRLDAPVDSFPVQMRSQVKNINLQQLFAFAESMKLDVLSSQNIKGTANCNLMVNLRLDKTFSPSFAGTIAYAKANFRNMELIQVAPIQHALRFLRKERTGHLYFEDVTTHFLVRENQFITPGLSLNSNLTAFELSGSYTMDGPAQLNMDVNVLSVLFGNNKRRIERIQNDSLGTQRVQKKQHLQLSREQNKYKVRLSDRKEREKSGLALRQQFNSFLRQHQIDTVFTMNE